MLIKTLNRPIRICFIMVLIVWSLISISGCSMRPPKTFVEVTDTANIGWRSIDVRDGLSYEDAWQTLVDVVAMRWDIETMDKEAGYLRSSWAFATGKDKSASAPYVYGRRLTAKFNQERNILTVKTEAYYQVKGEIMYGVDSIYNEDVFTEISGKLGRTAG